VRRREQRRIADAVSGTPYRGRRFADAVSRTPSKGCRADAVQRVPAIDARREVIA
jgi:hypothetical protein